MCSAEVSLFLELSSAEKLGFRLFTCLDLSQVTLFFSGIRIVAGWWSVALIFLNTVIQVLKSLPFCLLHFTADGCMYKYTSI